MIVTLSEELADMKEGCGALIVIFLLIGGVIGFILQILGVPVTERTVILIYGIEFCLLLFIIVGMIIKDQKKSEPVTVPRKS